MISVSDAKSYLGLSGNADDANLLALIERITDSIEREVDWYFRDPRATSEVLDGTGTDRLFLRQDPHSGTAVVVESRSGPTDSWTVVDTADYEIDGRGIFVAGIWARGRRNYRVSYAEGFDCPPKDIEQLLLEILGSIWGRRALSVSATGSAGLGGIQSETIGDYSYTLAPGSSGGSSSSIFGGSAEESARWNATLNRWRRKRL